MAKYLDGLKNLLVDANKLILQIEDLGEEIVEENQLEKELRDENLRDKINGYFKRSFIPIGIGTVSATAVGLSPIPFSDAFLLFPIQTTMMFCICGVYGIERRWDYITSILKSLIIVLAGAFSGIGLATLLKFIPIVNTYGMAIDSTISGSVTLIIGLACTYSFKNYMIKNGTIDLDLSDENLINDIKLESKKWLPVVKEKGIRYIREIIKNEEFSQMDQFRVDDYINESEKIQKKCKEMNQEIKLDNDPNKCSICHKNPINTKLFLFNTNKTKCNHTPFCIDCFLREKSVKYCSFNDCQKPFNYLLSKTIYETNDKLNKK